MSSTTNSPSSRRRRGAELESAIYAAALAELAEVGYRGLTMEGIAARARTGKAAVYRRWTGKRELVVAALRRAVPPMPEADPRLSLRENLRAMLAVLCTVLAAGEATFPGNAVLAGAFDDPMLRAAFVDEIVRPRQSLIESLLLGAERAGELRQGAPAPLAAKIGPALIVHHLLLTGDALGVADLDPILDAVLTRA